MQIKQLASALGKSLHTTSDVKKQLMNTLAN